MDPLNILVKAKEIANYMQEHKFRYSNENNSSNWAGAKEKKKSNCANYVCYVLQELGILKKDQTFYCNSNNNIVYRGTDTESRVKKKFYLIKVGKTPLAYRSHMKPGDICLFRLHTNIYAGSNEKGMIWWDAGKSATVTGKSGGIFTKIHRARSINAKINYILRLKE